MLCAARERGRGCRRVGAMRGFAFEKLSNELAVAAANAMPSWWERIDSDPKWRTYSECGATPSSLDPHNLTGLT